jgi:CheY-like chemotaxis protein
MRPTVLIVDDHAGFRRAARAVLEAEGYDVVAESATGGEALEAAERVQPTLVLLDIGLPDIDGIEVAARLTTADRELSGAHVQPRRRRLLVAPRTLRRSRIHSQGRDLRRRCRRARRLTLRDAAAARSSPTVARSPWLPPVS